MIALQQRYQLALHGCVILLLGLLAGIGFSIAATGSVESAAYGNWRFAHMEGILNGLLVLAAAGIWPLMDCSSRALGFARIVLILGCYANIVGPLITGLLIGHRVIVPATLLESVVVYGFYIPGTLPLLSLGIFVVHLFLQRRSAA